MFILVSSKNQLFLISDYLEVILVHDLEMGRINDIQFIQHKDEILIIHISHISVYKLKFNSCYDVERSLLLFHSNNYMTIEIKHSFDLETTMTWIRGVRIDTTFTRIYIWSESDISIYHLKTYELMQELIDVCPGTLITATIAGSFLDTIFAGTFDGEIYSYKVTNPSTLQHKFRAHRKAVLSLIISSNRKSILSVSSDAKVKVWSLENYVHLYTFELQNVNYKIIFAQFLQSDVLVYNQHNNIVICRIKLIGESFNKLKTLVKQLLWCKDKMAALCEDNSVRLYDRQGDLVCTVFPPPTADDIKEMHFSEELEWMILLLHSGNICIYTCKGETALLCKIIYNGDIKDSEERAMLAPIITLKLLPLDAPITDCEININKEKRRASMLSILNSYKEKQYYCAMVISI